MNLNKSKIILTALVSLLLMSGCGGLKEIKTQVPRPTLESSHVIQKDIEYCINKEEGKQKCFTLKKNGMYINNQDTSELLHYIDKLK